MISIINKHYDCIIVSQFSFSLDTLVVLVLLFLLYVVNYIYGNSPIFSFSLLEVFIMLNRIFVIFVLFFSILSVQAAPVLLQPNERILNDFYLIPDIGTTRETGGEMTVFYEGGQFRVNISSWSIVDYDNIIDKWITPLSVFTFDPVKIYEINGNWLTTSLGFGYLDDDGRITYNNPSSWKITTIDIPPPTSSVPEPGSLALLGLGILGITATRKRKKV